MPTTKLKELGNSYDGKVFSYPMSKLETILDLDLPFQESGKVSLLKALKVPKKFFEKQEVIVKRDLLLRQKVEFGQTDEIVLLMRNNEVVFCSILTPSGFEDPRTKFNINTENNFTFLREDLTRGYQRFVYFPDGANKEEFTATLFMDVPVFYHSKWVFESGLFRIICTNGLVDNILSNTFALKVHDLDADMMEGITSGVIQGIKDCSNNYDSFLKYLKEKECSIEQARDLVYTWKNKHVIDKTLSKEVLAWLEYVEVAPDKVSDPTMPDSFSCYMDLLNVVTRYAQDLESMSKIKKVEQNMFKIFYELYKADTKASLQGIHVKQLIENLGIV